MGGDQAPEAMVAGAIRAAREGLRVVLVGREAEVRGWIERLGGSSLGIEVADAADAIGAHDHATDVRGRRDASINVAMRLLRERKVGALVAQGHTGATMASALFGLGRLAGVERPAILVELPSRRGPVALLDAGANADARPEFLQHFALMGAAYASAMRGKAQPSVGLLSIGEEPEKGSALVIEAHALLRHTPGLNFYGNVEGRDIFLGTTDVVVTDGFTGNVALKLAEGEARVITGWVRDALTRGGPLVRLGGLLVRGALRSALADRLDPAAYGAQPLLGVNGLVFVGHGSSDARAVHNALRAADRAVQADLLARVGAQLEALRGLPAGRAGE